MTRLIDEFIDDLEKTAKQLELLQSAERDPLLILSYQRSAMSALRLAEYLKELRHLRNITEYIKDTPCATACFEGENMNIIEWAEKQLEAKP